MENSEKRELLQKPFWSIADIGKYFNVGREKANEMYQSTIKENPKAKCPFYKSYKYVQVDSILKNVLNSSRKEELKIYGNN